MCDPLRGLRRWMARASSSLPVPVSPWISTVASVGATVSICFSTWRRPRALAHDVLKSVLEIDLLLEILLLLAKAVAQLRNLAKDHGIVHRHGHLVGDLHQHLGFALRERVLHAAGNSKRANGLATMNQRNPAARLHAEVSEVVHAFAEILRPECG